MSFEPLGTDEPLEESTSSRKPRDFENELVGGCFTIVGGSLTIFLLTWWPFLIFPFKTSAGLFKALAIAGIPVLIVGLVLTRLVKLAGAVGFAAGMFIGAMFLFMNLNLELIGFNDPNALPPEYPQAWGWVIPAAWFLAGMAVMLFAYGNPKNSSEGGG